MPDLPSRGGGISTNRDRYSPQLVVRSTPSIALTLVTAIKPGVGWRSRQCRRRVERVPEYRHRHRSPTSGRAPSKAIKTIPPARGENVPRNVRAVGPLPTNGQYRPCEVNQQNQNFLNVLARLGG